MELYNAQQQTMPSNDKRYCVPIALAILADKPAAEVSLDMIAKGARRYRQGSYQSDWQPYAEQVLGLNLKVVTSEIKRAGGKTVRSVARILNPKNKYLIVVRGHVLAYSDGKIQDWSALRKNRLQAVYQVSGGCSAVATNKRPAKPKKSNIKQMCNEMFDRGDKVADVARELGITYANAHYYFRVRAKSILDMVPPSKRNK